MKKSVRRKTASHRTRRVRRKNHFHLISIIGLVVGLCITVYLFGNFPHVGLFAAQKEVPNAFNASDVQREQGRIIVKLTSGSPSELSRKEQRVLERVNRKSAKRQAKIESRLEALQSRVLKVSPEEEAAVLNELQSDPDVLYAEVDAVARVSQIATPNDAKFSELYGLHNTGQTVYGWVGTPDADIDAPEAWVNTTGGSSLVAVLDTGIDLQHPELASKIVNSASCIQSTCVSAAADDDHGHGTHVAGTIAAVSNNGEGVAGVCPDCRLLNVKVWDSTGSGYYSWMANAIVWAADNGAKVINISGGGTSSSQLLTDAVNYAWSRGVLVVAAAGNSNSSSMHYPGSIEPVVGVASTDSKDQKSGFSNYGTWVDIAAPGSVIYSTLPTTSDYSQYSNWGNKLSYGYLQGTSMATPHVAGAAALVWASEYGTSATAVRSRLLSTADPISGTGTYWMNGRVNAGTAVGYVVATDTPTPTSTPSATPTNTPTPTSTPVPTYTPTPTPGSSLPGLSGVYYNNADFTGSTVSRVDGIIDFNWGRNAPVSGIQADTFSVRWIGYVTPQYSQTYRFYARTNDGVRLWVNNQQIINNWRNQSTTEVSGSISLQAGQRYPIVMEYYDNTTNAVAQLRWSSPSLKKQIIPGSRLSR